MPSLTSFAVSYVQQSRATSAIARATVMTPSWTCHFPFPRLARTGHAGCWASREAWVGERVRARLRIVWISFVKRRHYRVMTATIAPCVKSTRSAGHPMELRALLVSGTPLFYCTLWNMLPKSPELIPFDSCFLRIFRVLPSE